MPVVLIIDDDASVRQLFLLALQGSGYTVLLAEDGNKGVELFKDNEIDLVITDIVMPEKDGIEAIIEMRAINPNVPIIAISGGGRSGPETYLEVCKALRVSKTYTKPVRIPDLLEDVAQLCKGE